MHGIILHEEYRERMKKFSSERLGDLVHNLFLVDEGKEPLPFPDDEALDMFSEIVCARLQRDIAMSDKQRNNGTKGGAPVGNQNAKKTTKNNPKTTQKQPKNNPKTTQNKPLLPITNNQLPITNNLLPITNKDLKEKINKEKNLFAEEIISYLNFKAGTHYQPRGKAEELINARMNDGYTVDDFKRVIDKKVREWKGTSYEKFIRPNTLFAPSHFDEYLNQPETKGTDDMLMDWLNGKESNDTGGVFADSTDNESSLYGFKVYPE